MLGLQSDLFDILTLALAFSIVRAVLLNAALAFTAQFSLCRLLEEKSWNVYLLLQKPHFCSNPVSG